MVRSTVECPECGELSRAGSAGCAHCGAIFAIPGEPTLGEVATGSGASTGKWLLIGCLGLMVLFAGILAVVAWVVLPRIGEAIQEGQRRMVKADLRTLCDAIDQYVEDNGGAFPESLEALGLERGQVFLEDPLMDPWANPYDLEPPTDGRPYRVVSYGADGQPGGEGADADLDNFNQDVRSALEPLPEPAPASAGDQAGD